MKETKADSRSDAHMDKRESGVSKPGGTVEKGRQRDIDVRGEP